LGPIQFADGRFNSEQYINYIQNQLLPWAEENYPDMEIYLLQDNAPIHTSLVSRAFTQLVFGDNIISHAPKSPDANPMENGISMVTRGLRSERRIFPNTESLRNAILQNWNDLGNNDQYLQTLANSIRGRYQAILDPDGGYTKY
jgi:hypothetical protein